jgi:trigger factor
MGVAPERLAKQLADDGRLPVAAGEVLRGKAMNLIAERVKVTDSAGHEVDVKAALNAPVQDGATDADEDAATDADEDDDAEA